MEKTMEEVRVKAAKLRVLAAEQRAMAAGYRRQAAHPAYPGQEIICPDKADQIAALAARSEAEADLLERDQPSEIGRPGRKTKDGDIV